MANVSEYKKKIVQDMTKLMRQYNIIGMVNMENMPAPQLQAMRSDLRGKIDMFMTKKRLMRIAIEKLKDEKKGIEELEKYFEGMPALIFTNENPFKLSKLLQKSKTKAPAKAGQTAPEDIVVNKGPTPFAPGPVISELSAVGLKVGVESGKVAVKEDTVIVKKGEKISPKVAEVLTRLDIKPMEVGLGLVAAYEDGIIYQKDILAVDEKEYNNNINLAATQAFNLAFNITYVTKDNISLLISKSFSDAKALGISQEILDKGIIESLLSKAENEMLSLKNTTNIEITETQKETKPEEKKIEAPIQEKIEKKEEKVLEEGKKIIEEEKELEKEKPKEVPAEKEVQEAVKEEEEKNLEKERIEKEKELERVEKEKEEIKRAEEIKVKPKEEVDEKVSKMVEKTKKFIEGKEETASDIIEEVKKEKIEEEKPEIQEKPQETKVQEEKPGIKEEIKEKIQEEKKEEKKIEEPIVKEVKEVPSAHDLQKKKEEEATASDSEKEKKEHKEVEELTKELIKKGTLRKK